MEHAWYIYALTVLAGILTGYINTLAGSGSAFSLTALGMLGLPIDVANGTNRLAILLQNVVAVRGFHGQKKLDWRAGLWLAVPACVGAIFGAILATQLETSHFRKAVGVAMVVVLAMLFAKPKRWIEGKTEDASRLHWAIRSVMLFFIGVYGGFIQMGVGVFLLSTLVLGLGYDVLRGNAVKVLIVLCFTALALGIFAYNGKVDWAFGLLLSVGSMTGAWVATRQAAKRGAKFIRWLLIVVVTYAALKYLGLLQWL